MNDQSFEQFVIDLIVEHNDCLGMCESEIQEVVENSTHKQRLSFLLKRGYDVYNDYKYFSI